MTEWVVVAGSFLEGIVEIRGPFWNENLATEYMEAHNMGHHPKAVFEIESPEDK